MSHIADVAFVEFFRGHGVEERTAHEYRQRYVTQALTALAKAILR